MNFVKLPKLKKGDRVAIVSPSFAAPGQWPHVYEYALKRVKDVFGLEPVEFSVTKKLGATAEERSKDLIDAFENKEIKAVIASLGGDDQVTYIKNLPRKPFIDNPKPFFGYSDNTHFINHLWESGEGITWGGCLESIDEMLRHGIKIPSLTEFEKVVLFVETSEEIPPSAYVFRVFRALGERGILKRVKGLLVGRPKAWEFNKRYSDEEKVVYKKGQLSVILETFRKYNKRALSGLDYLLDKLRKIIDAVDEIFS